VPAPFVAGLIAVSSPLVFLAALGVTVIVGIASLRPAIILFLAFIAGCACGLREQAYWNTGQLPASHISNGFEGPAYISGLVLEAHPFSDILIAPNIRLRLGRAASGVARHPGDLIVFRGQIATPAYPRNPNDFDEARFLRHEGIAGTVQSISSVIIDHRSHHTVKYGRWRLQQWIGRRIGALFPDQAPRALVHAMILGNRTHLDLDPDTRIYILHPSVSGTENDDSIVFLLVFGDTRILFMGNVEKKAEQLIIRYFSPLLQANVVKISHHGSATSSTEKFIATTVSNYAIVSAGRNNRFSHPDPTIV